MCKKFLVGLLGEIQVGDEALSLGGYVALRSSGGFIEVFDVDRQNLEIQVKDEVLRLGGWF